MTARDRVLRALPAIAAWAAAMVTLVLLRQRLAHPPAWLGLLAAAANLVAALRAAGGEPDDLVSLVVYATELDEYRASLSDLGEVWRHHFGRRYPAMALVGVSALLNPLARVELMGVAVVPDD